MTLVLRDLFNLKIFQCDFFYQILSSCRFDFEQSAFSPTELDDSFMFYYRHPKNENSDTKSSKIITSNLPDNIQVTTINGQDFSKHPPPCQKYLQNVIGKSIFEYGFHLI